VERRLAVHARAHQQALIVAIALASTSAFGAPKSGPAKKEFDRGVKAYTASDFEGAADAMAKSYALEKDPETLFAWAQAERKLENCDKAVELYNELLVFDLPAENKQVVEQNVAECKQILAAAQKPAPETKEPASEPAPPPPSHEDKVADAPAPPPPPEGGRAWWKNPVGDGLLVLGIAGLAVGGVELASAAGADSDKGKATTYADFKRFEQKADSDGKTGVIAAGAGGALVVISIIWYATHKSHAEHPVTGWLAPSGGGLAVGGRF
jgi:hypothetical protein